MKCPFCSVINGKKAKFCGNCGAPTHLRFCPECESLCNSQSVACAQCGAQLANSESASSSLLLNGQSVAPVAADDIAIEGTAVELENMLRHLDEEIHRLDRRGKTPAAEAAVHYPAVHWPRAVDMNASVGAEAKSETASSFKTNSRPMHALARLPGAEPILIQQTPPEAESPRWKVPLQLFIIAGIAVYSFMSLPPEAHPPPVATARIAIAPAVIQNTATQSHEPVQATPPLPPGAVREVKPAVSNAPADSSTPPALVANTNLPRDAGRKTATVSPSFGVVAGDAVSGDILTDDALAGHLLTVDMAGDLPGSPGAAPFPATEASGGSVARTSRPVAKPHRRGATRQPAAPGSADTVLRQLY